MKRPTRQKMSTLSLECSREGVTFSRSLRARQKVWQLDIPRDRRNRIDKGWEIQATKKVSRIRIGLRYCHHLSQWSWCYCTNVRDSVFTICWNKALWLASPSTMTISNQSECFISPKHNYATLKIVYDRAQKKFSIIKTMRDQSLHKIHHRSLDQ